jgi:hypothetical protein
VSPGRGEEKRKKEKEGSHVGVNDGQLYRNEFMIQMQGRMLGLIEFESSKK